MELDSSRPLHQQVRPGVSQRGDFSLQAARACLLVIDIQKYLSHHPKHPYFTQKFVSTIENIQRLAGAFRQIRDDQETCPGCEVLFTSLQSATKNGRDISLDYKLSGPELAGIPHVGDSDIFLDQSRPDVDSGKGDILLPKTSCSVFQSTNLDYLLRNLQIEQLVVVGQLTDQCVESAVRDAADLGYLVTVVDDACVAYSAENHAKGLDGMRGFCRILTTDHVVKELEMDANRKATAVDISEEAICSFLVERGFTEAAQELHAHLFGDRDRSHRGSS